MTQDLTKINSPWGLLDAETQEALKEAYRNGKVVQEYTKFGWGDLADVDTPGWLKTATYRIRPEPVVVSRWVNVYDGGCQPSRNSRELADRSGRPNRICVLRIDYCDGVPSFHREEN